MRALQRNNRACQCFQLGESCPNPCLTSLCPVVNLVPVPVLELRASEFVIIGLCTCLLRAVRLGLPQTFVFLRCNLCWFLQPNIIQIPLLALVPWSSAGTPCSSGEISAGEISFPFLNHYTGYGSCPSYISAPPIGLNMASLYS